ncbi:hypothetical protein HPB49_026303 [Dermacentor silvarum]|nr:hypothetical protein HPB49_026303 [Dermacentor silvarum]
MDQLEEEWRPLTLDDPWRLQLWPYRPHSPIVWFAQVDAQLYVNGVSSQLWRYLLLKREIPTDVFSRLDLLSSDQNMYEGLKTAFFQHFGVPVPDHLRSMTQFPSTADASEGMAQTTSSSSPSASGERCAPARESSAAPTPQEPLCGGNTTTVSPASGSFPDDEQPPATLPAPSTTQLVSPLFLSNDHLASTPVHTEESAFTPPELHGVHSPSRGDDSAASEQHCGKECPTYAAVVKGQNHSQEINNEIRDYFDQENKEKSNKSKLALIITSDQLDKEEMQSIMKRKVDPHELGVLEAEMRPARDGIVVMASSKKGLQKLEEFITNDAELASKLKTKHPKEKNLEIKVIGIDGQLGNDEIEKKLFNKTVFLAVQRRLK